jgi:hypothetical protein
MFTTENYCKAFKAAELVLLNAQVVLDYLKVRLRTLLAPLLQKTL